MSTSVRPFQGGQTIETPSSPFSPVCRPVLVRWYAANNKHAIEILLTLKGLKPCTLLVHGGSPTFNTTMVNACLRPVFDTYNLATYGFTLLQITHAGPTTAHWGFENAWLLADTRSPMWGEVQAAMVTPRSLTDKMSELRIGRALGYPVSGQGHQETVVYMDEREREDLSKLVGEEVESVIALEFFCPEGNEEEWKNIIRHYFACMKIVEAYGGKLTIDLSRHPKLDAFFDAMFTQPRPW